MRESTHNTYRVFQRQTKPLLPPDCFMFIDVPKSRTLATTVVGETRESPMDGMRLNKSRPVARTLSRYLPWHLSGSVSPQDVFAGEAATAYGIDVVYHFAVC